MTLILGMSAMVVDIGLLMYEKQKLGDSLDAAALAGVQDIMNDPLQAEIMARQYAIENGINNPEIIINTTNNEVTVHSQKDVTFYFAKAIGFSHTTIHESSTARINPISSVNGIVPFAVVQQSFEYGELYSLKNGGSEGSHGNYGALALGGKGASNYSNNLKYGYDGTLEIGMKVNTEPGNMSGPTKDAIEYRLNLDAGNYDRNNYQTASRESSRILYVPVVDSIDVQGRNEVTIVGFAAFYLEGVPGNGNDSRVEGRFLKTIFPGDWDETGQSDFGLYAVKLVH